MIFFIDLEEEKSGGGWYAEDIIEDDDMIQDVAFSEFSGNSESSEETLYVLDALEVRFELRHYTDRTVVGFYGIQQDIFIIQIIKSTIAHLLYTLRVHCVLYVILIIKWCAVEVALQKVFQFSLIHDGRIDIIAMLFVIERPGEIHGQF